MLEELNEMIADSGWEAIDDCVIVCPCGEYLEWDAHHCEECGSGNPLIKMGLI